MKKIFATILKWFYTILKWFYTILMYLVIFSCIDSCIDSCAERHNNKYFEYAEKVFIDEASYMNEREALSTEIGYYKSPQILKKQHNRDLTGKEIIHICNEIEKENTELSRRLEMGEIMFAVLTKVSDIKDYALDHPDEIIAHEFYFEGIFTTYNIENKYNKRSMKIIVIPKVKDQAKKYRTISEFILY